MVKHILVVMFILPAFCTAVFYYNKQWTSMITWGGISIANFGIWLQTTS